MGPSVQQLLIILLIVVLLFGAKKIPELAKGLGKGIKSFKSEMEDDKKTENVEKVEEKKEETATAVKTEDTAKNA
ncbi:twin-arginine translocase TatA/TatE family subunit [uncultured Campylobacter sp.]|jgi:sec-independent protein translocase protein tatA/E homolog|uniref:twin-arginine translocase TatA/TatE family subunit n=1 Tax=uncultured Campylobacter sp. TaxID=218934 RepID=UPI0028EB6530|nr:twin-arginine translocase TatA/TatE family subunit [uncultured Campylobacter sp.]